MKCYRRLLAHWILMTSILFRIVRICCSEFTRIYQEKRKHFSKYFVPFLKYTSNFKHFRKLKAVKDMVREMSKKPHFRIPFGSQHLKGSQTLVKSAWGNFYHIFSSLWGKLISKMSPLVICEILGAFVNTSILDDKYPLRNWGNLPLPIQSN